METTATSVPSKKIIYEIVNGPSKFDLMEATFSRKFYSRSKFTLELKDSEGNFIELEVGLIALMAVESADDILACRDGHLWRIYSDICSVSPNNRRMEICGSLLSFYSTKSRKGKALKLSNLSQFSLMTAAFGCETAKKELEGKNFKIPDVVI
ncbi:MAG: hypothetical protein WCJ59_02180 [bacterium]